MTSSNSLSIGTEQSADASHQQSRLALIIGNGHYPDAAAPLNQPINDARALTATLRQSGFDVDVVEDASKDDMQRAIGRLKSKIRPDTVTEKNAETARIDLIAKLIIPADLRLRLCSRLLGPMPNLRPASI